MHNPETDLDKLSYCLALAVKKHIEFSRGFTLWEDLEWHAKEMEDDPTYWFSYKFKDELKIEPKKEIDMENFNPIQSQETSP